MKHLMHILRTNGITLKSKNWRNKIQMKLRQMVLLLFLLAAKADREEMLKIQIMLVLCLHKELIWGNSLVIGNKLTIVKKMELCVTLLWWLLIKIKLVFFRRNFSVISYLKTAMYTICKTMKSTYSTFLLKSTTWSSPTNQSELAWPIPVPSLSQLLLLHSLLIYSFDLHQIKIL